jgi:hypothetical protein
MAFASNQALSVQINSNESVEVASPQSLPSLLQVADLAAEESFEHPVKLSQFVRLSLNQLFQ